ncbi:hypothetical protein [Flavobacterium microcysteis]|uniref:50S ribosomal protein L29 n=1 Tax=Flavobacterium microcysteis TaxID=2596891 RepID=A0A501QE04_9FLAO|nr:hypothetical protein [Flavobacterium microcysteis]TPD71099.1 hypothetical protein FJA49_04150 [Flavobacterium microcysteis]
MSSFTFEELIEAKKSLDSTLSKCEKAFVKLKENSPQHTLMIRRINALRISVDLIERELLKFSV